MPSPEWLGIFAGILDPVSKTSLEIFWQTKLKICGNEYSFFNPFEPSVAFHRETRHDLQCKPNGCFYVKYKSRLKYNNTTPFLLNNYLLKYAQHMLGVFSTENLSIHHKILIGIKDQSEDKKGRKDKAACHKKKT